MAGELQAAAVVGAEGIYSRRRARKEGIEQKVTSGDNGKPDELMGTSAKMSTDLEEHSGLTAPVHYYSLFESAIRAARRESIDEHRTRIARLLQRSSAVAEVNPDSWLTDPLTVEGIRDESPDNRMIAFPYTKRMCSNWYTDQAAAVLLCSVELAERLSIPRDSWVFPHSSSDGNDAWYVSNRLALDQSPAIRIACNRALEGAGIGVDDLKYVDIYSCFASAMQVAVKEIGLTEERPLTLTGGMAYFGGPLSNYVTHSIGAMVNVLREDSASYGLVTANGGYLTKHALCVYSSKPPVSGYRHQNVQSQLDNLPKVPVVKGFNGVIRVEGITVVYEAGESRYAVVAGQTPDHGRVWAMSIESDLIREAISRELVGAVASVRPNGSVVLN
jgi:acetyl-CoA C-acetyltransferase